MKGTIAVACATMALFAASVATADQSILKGTLYTYQTMLDGGAGYHQQMLSFRSNTDVYICDVSGRTYVEFDQYIWKNKLGAGGLVLQVKGGHLTPGLTQNFSLKAFGGTVSGFASIYSNGNGQSWCAPVTRLQYPISKNLCGGISVAYFDGTSATTSIAAGPILSLNTNVMGRPTTIRARYTRGLVGPTTGRPQFRLDCFVAF
jgi:hypothetical protein